MLFYFYVFVTVCVGCWRVCLVGSLFACMSSFGAVFVVAWLVVCLCVHVCLDWLIGFVICLYVLCVRVWLLSVLLALLVFFDGC